jgi:tripartite-type tricarboxylate transporter receptor subunit TctC
MRTLKSLSKAYLVVLVAGALALAATPATAADKWKPSKPITILVGFTVGGAMDTAARLQGDAMSKMLGVPVLIRNVPGAGGRNSVTILNRSKPDGYTMAAINLPGQAVNQVARGMKPDLRSFTWIGRQVSNPYFLQATTKKGMDHWTNFKQMTTAKKPIRAGITGTGGNTFPISVITANLVGFPVEFIAGFKGPELITGIIRGDITITNLPLTKRWVTAVQSGESKAIAVYLPERHPKFPKIPTGVEQGFPELGSASLVGQNLYALPPKTPAKISSVLEAALVKVNNDAALKERIQANGNIVAPLSAGNTSKLIGDMITLVGNNSALLKKYIK